MTENGLNYNFVTLKYLEQDRHEPFGDDETGTKVVASFSLSAFEFIFFSPLYDPFFERFLCIFKLDDKPLEIVAIRP